MWKTLKTLNGSSPVFAFSTVPLKTTFFKCYDVENICLKLYLPQG
jgi:hypothetical protein